MTVNCAVPECMPFSKENTGTEACLCIHGFTGCPGIYIPLSLELFNSGCSVRVPLLAGHGTKPEDLNNVNENDWFQDSAKELEQMLDKYETVHIIGLSLGGGIASWLAAKYSGHGHLGKLVLLSPGFGIKDKKYYAINFETAENKMIQFPKRTPSGNDDIRYGYDSMPLRSVPNIIRAADEAMEVLDLIRAPTLLLYSAADTIADPQKCEQAKEKIKSLVEAHCYETSEHNLLLGTDRVDVIKRIVDFISG